jgi:hypothetical protein
MFGSILEGSSETPGAARATPPTREEHAERQPARDPVGVVSRTGVMTALADGEFHPDEKVTRPAFYAIVTRLVDALDAAPSVMAEMFPGGYRETLSPQGAGAEKKDGIAFVSGREAVQTLQTLARRVGL